MLIEVLCLLWQLCITSEKSEVSIPKVKETGIFDPALWYLSLDVNRDDGFEEPDTKLWRNQLKRITNLPLGLSAHWHSPNKLLEALLCCTVWQTGDTNVTAKMTAFCHCSFHSSDEQACSWQKVGGGSLQPGCTACLGPPPAGADPLVHLTALPRGFWISSLLWRQGHRVPSDHSISIAIWIKKQWKKKLLVFEMRFFFLHSWLFQLFSQQDNLSSCLHRGLGAELLTKLAKQVFHAFYFNYWLGHGGKLF